MDMRIWGLLLWLVGSGCDGAFGWDEQPADTLTPIEQDGLEAAARDNARDSDTGGYAGAYAPEPAYEGEAAYEGEGEAAYDDDDAGVVECELGTYELWGARSLLKCGGDTAHCCGQAGIDGEHYRSVCLDLCDHLPGTVAMGNVGGTSVRCLQDWGQCDS